MYHAASFTMTVVKVQSENSIDGNSKTMPSNFPCCKGVALLNNLGLVFLHVYDEHEMVWELTFSWSSLARRGDSYELDL